MACFTTAPSFFDSGKFYEIMNWSTKNYSRLKEDKWSVLQKSVVLQNPMMLTRIFCYYKKHLLMTKVLVYVWILNKCYVSLQKSLSFQIISFRVQLFRVYIQYYSHIYLKDTCYVLKIRKIVCKSVYYSSISLLWK